jgi:hypothetical protein
MYQKMRTVFVEKFDKDLNHPFVIVPSVLTAWFCSSIFTSPISLVKVRLQTQKSKKGFFSTFYEVYQQGTHSFPLTRRRRYKRHVCWL